MGYKASEEEEGRMVKLSKRIERMGMRVCILDCTFSGTTGTDGLPHLCHEKAQAEELQASGVSRSEARLVS